MMRSIARALLRAATWFDPSIEILPMLHKIEFRPGDRFVIFFPHPLQGEAHARIRSMWRRFTDVDDTAGSMAVDFPLLILDQGASLGVVRKGAAP